MSVVHATRTGKDNSLMHDVSSRAWNEAHSIGDASIPLSALETGFTRTLFIHSNAFYTNGAPSNYGRIGAVSCQDGQTREIYFVLQVPKDFLTFTTVKLIWVSPPAAGNMYMRWRADNPACGEASSTNREDKAYGTVATGGAGIINCSEGPAGQTLALANAAIDDILGIEFSRDATHVNDTLNDTVSVLGLEFTYSALR